MVSPTLLSLVRCPACRDLMKAAGQALLCPQGHRYPRGPERYLDLRPRQAFAEMTKYVDEALHADARHEHVSPPLLAAGVRNDVLRRQLAPSSADRLVDLGCGSGRALVWNHDLGAYAVGVDVSPYFAEEALASVDLALGDLRQLPFDDGTFTKAYALDVLEHLSREALEGMMAEANRVLAPNGQLFVYTHVRRNSRLALGLRWINKLAAWLDRAGLIDVSQERLRKSDHLNPLADVPDLENVVRQAGFRIAWIRFYTPLVGGFVENILMRLAERVLARRAARRRGAAPGRDAEPTQGGSSAKGGSSAEQGSGLRAESTSADLRAARTAAKARIARRGPLYLALRVATWVMKIDLALFGRVTSGPFFALLVKDGSMQGPDPRAQSPESRAL